MTSSSLQAERSSSSRTIQWAGKPWQRALTMGKISRVTRSAFCRCFGRTAARLSQPATTQIQLGAVSQDSGSCTTVMALWLGFIMDQAVHPHGRHA